MTFDFHTTEPFDDEKTDASAYLHRSGLHSKNWPPKHGNKYLQRHQKTASDPSYLPHKAAPEVSKAKAVAEVSNHKKLIGRGCGIQLFRRELISDSSVLILKCFEQPSD